MNIINTYGIAGSISLLSRACRDGATISFAYENSQKKVRTITSKVIKISYQNDLNNYDGWYWTIKVYNEDGREHTCVLDNISDILVLPKG